VKSISLNATVNEVLALNRMELDNHSVSAVFKYSVCLEDGENTKALIGLVNGLGTIICEPKFTYLGDFVDGVAPCVINEMAGYVQSDGTYLLEPNPEYVMALEPIDGICIMQLRRNKKWKLYSINKKKFLTEHVNGVNVELEARKVEVLDSLHTDSDITLFRVYSDDYRIGLIRKDGIWLISYDNCF